jgi:hypothetical protein
MKSLVLCLAVSASPSWAQRPATAPSAPARAPATPAEKRALLCQVDALLDMLDDARLPPPGGLPCPPTYSIDNLPADIFAKGSGVDTTADRDELINYYKFKALTLRSPEACAPLAFLEAKAATPSIGNQSWEAYCRREYYSMSIARALVLRAPDLGPVCQGMLTQGYAASAKRDVASTCRRFVASAGDVNAAAVVACEGDPARRKQCLDYFRAIGGDASACAGATGPYQAICRGFVAFSKAGPAKKPALCGANVVCRAMLGETVVSSQAARRVAVGMSPVLLKEAHEKLLLLDASSDPKDAVGVHEVDVREERAARLRAQFGGKGK